MNKFGEEAIRNALILAIKLRRLGRDLSGGAIVALDARSGTAAELAISALVTQGSSDGEARIAVAKSVAEAERLGAFAIVDSWYESAPLAMLLTGIGGNAQELTNWLSKPLPDGFVRLVTISGEDVSFVVFPYAATVNA